MTTKTLRAVLALTGLVMGVALWLITRYGHDTTPLPPLPGGLAFFVAVFGGALLFAADLGPWRRLVFAAAPGAALIAVCAAWVWAQLPPGTEYTGDNQRQPTMILAAVVSWFILLPFLQTALETGRARFPYSALYRHSWNNAFIAAIAWAFTGVVWLLLQLWGSLFKLIGIELFARTFARPSFAWMCTGLALGLGVALARENAKVLLTLRNVTRALARVLLPLLALIALGFLATLPFTGLHALWATRSATAILLSVVLLMLLLVNAVFQDGEDVAPYPTWPRRIIGVAVVALPLFAGLSAYALTLRIGQYGLMPERVYGVIIAAVLAVYALSYAVAVLRSRGPWPGDLRAINVTLSLVVAGLALLLHTPLLDPLGISARNQAARLLAGHVDAAKFDYEALNRLGGAGRAALDRLQHAAHPQHALIASRIAALPDPLAEARERARPLAIGDFTVLPRGHALPAGLLSYLQSSRPYPTEICKRKPGCLALAVDLGGNPAPEYVLVTPNASELLVFGRNAAGAWCQVGRLRHDATRKASASALRAAILAARARTVAPVHRDLEIDGVRYRFEEY